MNHNYELEIVSHLSQFDGKVLKPYFLDGVDTIGVWGGEPFEIRFHNRTNERVQIRLSVDGTCVATGKLASTSTDSSGMWVVNAYGSMSLRAWPETNHRGRVFLFGNDGNSVAVNTHGNTSNKGIIAAAIFTEKEPPRFERFWLKQPADYGWVTGPQDRVCTNTDGVQLCGDKNLMRWNGPAVGAGHEVHQKITMVQGLIAPKLDRVMRVRYIWWDDLKSKLSGGHLGVEQHPSGFPGDAERKMIDLSRVPGVSSRAVEAPRFI